MKKHILLILMALLVSGGAFAQTTTMLQPNSPEAESFAAENVRSGREYHDGLLKVYSVTVNAASYADNDTHYLTKTSAQLESDLGYSNVSHKTGTSKNGQKVATFTFSGYELTDFSTLKSRFVDYGFEIVDISGELQIVQ